MSIKNSLLIIIMLYNVYTYEIHSKEDTTKTYFFKPVIITATRSEILLYKSPTHSSIIPKQDIMRSNSITLADVLQLSEGIFIKDYGTNGGLKTLSLNGTSPENNLILINGIRINNYQNGLVDLSMINPDLIDKIEIVHGGNTSLYGTDAVGSVINILTSAPASRIRANFMLGKGSFDYNKIGFSLSNSTKFVGTNFSFFREYGKDNYRYYMLNSNELKQREHTAFYRNNYYISNQFTFGDWLFNTYTIYTQSDKNLPGSLIFSSTTASQLDRNLHFQFLSKYEFSNNLILELNSGWNYSFQKFKEPLYTINAFSKNNQVSINPQVNYKFQDDKSISFGLELVDVRLNGNDYPSTVKRTQKSAYFSSIINYDINSKYFNSLSIYPSIRYDYFSLIGSEVSPKIGLNFGVYEGFNLRMCYGRNYRVPTLNDLFYFDIFGSRGNPNLKPEYSRSFETGLKYTVNLIGKLELDYSYMYIHTNNKIVWQEIGPWIYSPQNLEKVLSKSSIIKIDYQFNILKIGMNYTYTDSRRVSKQSEFDQLYNKLLIYVPRNLWKFSFGLNVWMLSLNLNHMIVDKRFTDEKNINYLPTYQLTNGNVIFNINTDYGKLFLKLELNNLFNKSYQVLKDYPMPLRNYRVNLGLEY